MGKRDKVEFAQTVDEYNRRFKVIDKEAWFGMDDSVSLTRLRRGTWCSQGRPSG